MLQSKFYSARITCPCAVYMYKIMILLKISSEISWPISTKFHVYPTVEMGVRVCSNGHSPLTVMPIYGKKMIIKNAFFFFKTKNCSNDDLFICYNDRSGKNITSAYSLRWACCGQWASCFVWCFILNENICSDWPCLITNHLSFLFLFFVCKYLP